MENRPQQYLWETSYKEALKSDISAHFFPLPGTFTSGRNTPAKLKALHFTTATETPQAAEPQPAPSIARSPLTPCQIADDMPGLH